MTVLGGCGAWPAAGQAAAATWSRRAASGCSSTRATRPAPLAQHVDAADVDAVLVSHEHPITARTSIRCCGPGAARHPAPPLPYTPCRVRWTRSPLSTRMLTERRHTYDLHTSPITIS